MGLSLKTGIQSFWKGCGQQFCFSIDAKYC